MARRKSSTVAHRSGFWWQRFLALHLGYHVAISLFCHLLLIAVCEFWDHFLEVKYTDIDYIIFTDGARHILTGNSPFFRDTYRYTPLLAWMMIPNLLWFSQFGKILFSIFDIVAGCLLRLILLRTDPIRHENRHYHLLWLYNPFALIISTRGSAESVVCAQVILVIYLFIYRRHVLAGLCFGFVIHFKIYPVIYATTFYFALSSSKASSWIHLFSFSISKLKFFAAAAIGLAVPTFASYHFYGQKYLDEAWLYHLRRQDLQHNFSPYFFLYKNFATDPYQQKLLALLAFVPQMALTVGISFYYNFRCRKLPHLYMSLFVQTYLFVTLNKVITAQYFEWYICLIPLVAPYLKISARQFVLVATVWIMAIGQWLLPAYLYEFRKWNCETALGSASFVFVFINLTIVAYLQQNFSTELTSVGKVKTK